MPLHIPESGERLDGGGEINRNHLQRLEHVCYVSHHPLPLSLGCHNCQARSGREREGLGFKDWRTSGFPGCFRALRDAGRVRAAVRRPFPALLPPSLNFVPEVGYWESIRHRWQPSSWCHICPFPSPSSLSGKDVPTSCQ